MTSVIQPYDTGIIKKFKVEINFLKFIQLLKTYLPFQ